MPQQLLPIFGHFLARPSPNIAMYSVNKHGHQRGTSHSHGSPERSTDMFVKNHLSPWRSLKANPTIPAIGKGDLRFLGRFPHVCLAEPLKAGRVRVSLHLLLGSICKPPFARLPNRHKLVFAGTPPSCSLPTQGLNRPSNGLKWCSFFLNTIPQRNTLIILDLFACRWWRRWWQCPRLWPALGSWSSPCC